MTRLVVSRSQLKSLPSMASKSNGIEDMPSPNYTKLSEALRKTTNQQLLCNMFCGGKKCKYEWPDSWSDGHKALPGVYSHWVTDDIVAMARPNTDNIIKFDLIKYFHQFNIRSIINLQEPGEHSSCGNGLGPSGFSYEPTHFMDNDVYFYNFQWKDYSIVSDEVLLDMVKVLSFALTEGRVAIHCHAGLGRTGVLIATYLVYAFRCKPQDAISWVRSKRPNSIQTRGQIISVVQFSQFVAPFFVIYQHIINRQIGLNLLQILQRQRVLLHGYELRHLKNIPKIIYVLCERMLKLCRRHKVYSPGITIENNYLRRDVEINYQLSESDSFCKYFFSSATSGTELRRCRRPESNNTMDETSGIVSPDTDLTELEAFISPHKTDSKSIPQLVEISSICSEQSSSTTTLPPVEEISGAWNGISGTIPMIKVDSSESLNSQTSQEPRTGSTYSRSSEEPIESSMSESLTSIIESLGYGILKIDSSQTVYEKEYHFLANDSSNNTNNSYMICDKVIDDSDHYFDDSDSTESLDAHCSSGFVSATCGNSTEYDDECHLIEPIVVTEALLKDYTNYCKQMRHFMISYQKDLNTKPSVWEKLSHETSVEMLSGLLWSWIDSLSEPVLTKNSLCYIVLKAEKPLEALLKLDQPIRYTIEYLLRFIARLSPEQPIRTLLVQHLFARLTRQRFKISDGKLVPDGRDWPEMRKGTAGRICLFAETIISILNPSDTHTVS